MQVGHDEVVDVPEMKGHAVSKRLKPEGGRDSREEQEERWGRGSACPELGSPAPGQEDGQAYARRRERMSGGGGEGGKQRRN